MRSSVRCLFAALVLAVFSSPAFAQLQLATIIGIVVDARGEPIPGATIELADPLGAVIESREADATARFAFARVALGRYTLRASVSGGELLMHPLTVDAGRTFEVTLRFTVATTVVVDGGPDTDTPATRTALAGESIAAVPVRSLTKGIQEVVATLPGWATEDNGLLHVRGSDDGFLYVIDGVPVYERLDQLSGLGPDIGAVESVNVITGYIPAEFGYKAGGVIDVRSVSAADRWAGTMQIGAGSDDDLNGAFSSGGPLTSAVSLRLGMFGQRTLRFLDPVHPDNFHNRGQAAGANGQFTWVAASNVVTGSLGSGRSRFDVPNTEEQEEASQDQRQQVTQHFGSISWQRSWPSSTVTQLSGYMRESGSRLDGSAFDTPLFANADRSLGRVGVIAGLFRRVAEHSLKAGIEFQRLRLDESFAFAVTDPIAAEEAGLSDEAIEHDRANPFSFSDRATPIMWSVFLQDEWPATDRLTVSGGMRFDESRLGLVRRQVSPRAGAAYRAATGTVLRGSVSRFFQPPQPENLLLSTSDEAWELSPFADGSEGGADLEPERQWAFEAGINHQAGTLFRVDAAVWRRSIVEAADPNVFGGTTIIFPNAVARGRAAGVDLRVEVPRRRSWSGYVNLSVGAVRQNGPITGGLFLEDDVLEAASGEEFIPDHDQLIVAGGGVSWVHARSGASVSATVRYESGTPLEVGEEDEAELAERPGSEMADFDRGRVLPRTVASVVCDVPFWKSGRRSASIRASALNLFDDRYAFNFGNPFSGTHFGAPRTFSIAARLEF